jgi:pyruvate/2-oxoglutarate/acetoin dehydrogenase E1 component
VTRVINFAKAINEALACAMEADQRVICYGLGVDDPKGIFGTTLGLQSRFGEDRVFDMPTSENAMTGVGIGASMNGIRPVMTHQRLDFFLLAMDQLVNNAAKWYYMFGGQQSVPITIRLILGRGWGQGPTHSQNLQAWFAHVPGLKVVMPATPADAKGLLLSSIFDDNPVVFLEHRWLHNVEGEVPPGDFRVPIGKAHLVEEGNDLTIVSMSYMTIEALHATAHMKTMGIGCDLIDLRTIMPLDWEVIAASVRKTGRLLVLDTASETGSFAGEIIARAAVDMFDVLKQAPRRIAMPDYPSPTSPALSEGYYRRAEDIVAVVGAMLGKDMDPGEIVNMRKTPHDVPGDWFKGPF